MLEALALVGTIVPGSTVVFAGGVLVGLQVLHPWAAAAVAVSGAILGDGVSYWLGQRYHARIRLVWPFRRHPELLERGQAYFEKNGGRSVFLGRFLGPLRAIVPVVAGMSGMPPGRFYAMNVLSAFAWSAAHLLPGMLFGASIQLAGAVSSRLAVVLVAVALVLWLLARLAAFAVGHAVHFFAAARERVVRVAHRRPGAASRVVLSLFDPARPESPPLLAAALLLIGGGWLFLGILEEVLAKEPLVQIDRAVYAVLQSARSGWADAWMVAVTELGGATVTIAVVLAVGGFLAFGRRWRTLAHWLAAAAFAELLVWGIKYAVARPRPTSLYAGVGQFSFPSGHAALSIVVYGFLAYLLARGKSVRTKAAIAFCAAIAILLIAFSRLYLGVHWFSDVAASLTLGLAWVALLAIAHIHHVRDEVVRALPLALVVSGTLVLAGGATLRMQHRSDVERYAYRPALEMVRPGEWRTTRWAALPVARAELAGQEQEPFSIQWAGTEKDITDSLARSGWQRAPAWASKAALVWLLASATPGELPVLPKLDRGESPQLVLIKVLNARQRAVVRLWTSHILVGDAAGRVSLWYGMATLENVTHPAGMMSRSMTQPDFTGVLRIFEQDLLAAGATIVTRFRGSRPVLLIR